MSSPSPSPVPSSSTTSFTVNDCIHQTNALAQEFCPLLVNLYRSMGIDEGNITFLLAELYQHVRHVFSTTYREAEEGKERLICEIEEQSIQIPILSREVDDATAMNELSAAIQHTEGLRPKASLVKAIYQRLTEIKALATRVIQESLKELNVLYREVGVPQQEMLMENNGNDYSMNKINRIKQEINRMQEIRTQHIETVNSLAKETLRLCEELDVTPDEFTVSVSKPDFNLMDIHDPTDAASTVPSFTFSSLLHCIQKRLDRLHTHQQHQQVEANKYLEAIHKLWAKLNIPPSHQTQFLTSIQHHPLGEKTLRLYALEVSELERMKAEKMGFLIENVRKDIIHLWQQLHYTTQQQLLFRPFYTTPNAYDDNFLLQHEQERDRLQDIYTQWKPLLSLVEKRNEYRSALAEFEISCSDPDRLVSRKSNYLILKEEEKMRNMSTKWLPRTEQQLKEKIDKWEAEHGEPWKLNGERYLDRLQLEAEEYKANVAAKKKAAEEARAMHKGGATVTGSNVERASSMYGKKLMEGNRQLTESQHQHLAAQAKENKAALSNHARPITSVITPAKLNAAKRSLFTPTTSPHKQPQLALNQQQQQHHIHHHPQPHHKEQYEAQTPGKPISRTTPVRIGRFTPKPSNKENSSM